MPGGLSDVVAISAGGYHSLALVSEAAAPPTVCVEDSGGSGIEGVAVKYKAGYWRTFGTTGSDGCVVKEDLFAGTMAPSGSPSETAGRS